MNTTPKNPKGAPHTAGPNLPLADVVLTVTKFRDVLQGPFSTGTLSDHKVELKKAPKNVSLHVGMFQQAGEPPRTIQVGLKGAILRFEIATTDGETYRPIGITFARADKTQPSAVYCIAGTQTAPNSPFRLTGVNRSWLQVEDTIACGLDGLNSQGEIEKRPSHITYKFSVIIQRHSDGAIGILDPYVENDN